MHPLKNGNEFLGIIDFLYDFSDVSKFFFRKRTSINYGHQCKLLLIQNFFYRWPLVVHSTVAAHVNLQTFSQSFSLVFLI